VISIFDRYVLRVLLASTWITAFALTMIILLTQSMRLLELVISSDASSYYFLVMVGLSVPKFLEVILPIAFSIGTTFTCYRMILDRELIVLFASGLPASRLARPFVVFALFMMTVQFVLSGWISPVAIHNLQTVRMDIKSHYATLMFREGVFNNIGDGITAYVERRGAPNELLNLLIHDERGTFNPGKATTIIAQRGLVSLNESGQQLLIYDGTQYEQDMRSGQINRLDFKQYSLDILGKQNDLATRWREPDERTLGELLLPGSAIEHGDRQHINEFRAEAHRRLSVPLLYLSYSAIILNFLLLGTWDRRRQAQHIVKAGLVVVLIQVLYIVSYNATTKNLWLAPALYTLGILPTFAGFTLISLSRNMGIMNIGISLSNFLHRRQNSHKAGATNL